MYHAARMLIVLRIFIYIYAFEFLYNENDFWTFCKKNAFVWS